jgi:hypothetical protein
MQELQNQEGKNSPQRHRDHGEEKTEEADEYERRGRGEGHGECGGKKAREWEGRGCRERGEEDER